MTDKIPTLADLQAEHPNDPEALYRAAGAALDQHVEAAARVATGAKDGILSASEQRQFDAHEGHATELQRFWKGHRAEKVRRNTAQWGGQEVGGYNPAPAPSRNPTRDDAKRTLDALHRSGQLPDHAAEKATGLVTTQGTVRDQGIAARWVVAAGSETYRSAFAKLMSDPQKGHLLWNAQEQEAYRQVAEVQAEMRAMGETTGSAGGHMVPIQLDPAIMLSSGGSTNPLRRISRVVQTTGSQWSGITSAGVTAEWLPNDGTAGRAMADASPTLANPNIPVHLGDAWVPYSYEIGMDAIDFTNQLQTLMLDAADQLQATAYTTGTGTGQPKGLITALVAAGGSTVVASAVADTFGKGDPYALQNALPPRFSGRAQWVAALPIINAMAQMETTAGARLFPSVDTGRLLNRPIHELSNMDSVIDASQTNYILAYGDFNNFVIVDRIGTTLEFVPNLMDPTTGRPSGRRGYILYFRTGSDVVVPNAFRLLNA
ncbi:phage major capsid protein [Micromonospora chokoriensis]